MKILHINDIALVPSDLISPLRKKGIDADLLDYKIRTKYTDIKPILCNKFLSLIKYPVNLNDYDIIHLHYPVNILGLATLLRRPKNLIVHLHGTDARRSESNVIFKTILSMAGKQAKMFIYSTKDLGRIAKKYCSHSYHLPNPIDTNFFKPKNTKVNRRVLMLSALIKFKKPEIPLNAAKKMKDIQFDVIYYGPKADKEYYRKWESDNIHFIGPFTRDKLVETISRYPLIIGQFSGEIGVTELQAMSCAKPVVMYSNEKIPILNARTSEDVIKQVRKNLKNKTLGPTARKWIINNYDSDKIADRLIELYKKI